MTESRPDPEREPPEQRRDPQRPGGRPVDVEELADLQAGLLSEAEERKLLARIEGDPGAAAILAALEELHDELGNLPDEPLPDDVAARIDATIAAELANAAAGAPAREEASTDSDSSDGEAGGPSLSGDAVGAGRSDEADKGDAGAAVIDLDARRRRRTTLGRALIGVAAAAAVVAAIATVIRPTDQPDRHAGSGDGPVVEVTESALATLWPQVKGRRELGFVADPRKLENCLIATNILNSNPATVLGVEPVIVDGRYGMLVAIPTDDPVRNPGAPIALIVMGAACDTVTDPEVIARTTVAP